MQPCLVQTAGEPSPAELDGTVDAGAENTNIILYACQRLLRGPTNPPGLWASCSWEQSLGPRNKAWGPTVGRAFPMNPIIVCKERLVS